tara:strand:+ start:823 stop:1494 length:672 start_codon:yes stop_codon:yes gene_type:complete
MNSEFRSLVEKQHPKFEFLPDELIDLIKDFAVNDEVLEEKKLRETLEKFKKMKTTKQTLFLYQMLGKEFLNFKFPQNGMKVGDVFKHQILSSKKGEKIRNDVMAFLVSKERSENEPIFGKQGTSVTFSSNVKSPYDMNAAVFWKFWFILKKKFLKELKSPNFFMNCLNLIEKTNEKSLKKLLNAEKKMVFKTLSSHGNLHHYRHQPQLQPFGPPPPPQWQTWA